MVKNGFNSFGFVCLFICLFVCRVSGLSVREISVKRCVCLGEKKIDVVVMRDEKAKEKFNSFFGKNNISFYNKVFLNMYKKSAFKRGRLARY
jgi:hypothetical protein